MALLKIARMGHPVLVRPADAIEDPTAERVRRLVGHMAETMFDAEGIGLAAPQVYQSVRLILFFDAEEREAAHGRPPTVLINPEIEPQGDAIEHGSRAASRFRACAAWCRATPTSAIAASASTGA